MRLRLIALFLCLFAMPLACSSANFDVQTSSDAHADADVELDDAAPGRDAVMVKPPEAGADTAADTAADTKTDAAGDAAAIDAGKSDGSPDASPDTATDTSPATDADVPCSHCLGGTGRCPSQALDDWCWHSACGDRSTCYFTTSATTGSVCHCGA